MEIGPLQDLVTWYGINYTGTQMTQWDFQNKGMLGWTGTSSFVLEVPLRHLRPSVIYSVPCDQILQRAHLRREALIEALSREKRKLSFLGSQRFVSIKKIKEAVRVSKFDKKE